MNLTPRVAEKIGKNLHNRPGHPLKIIKDRIFRCFRGTECFDDLDPRVSVAANFDALLIPKDHPSRKPTDTYYLDDEHVLRTHTSAHQHALLSAGYTSFLVAGDVYRKDEIDRNHYPVFHQIEGVKLCDQPTAALHRTIELLLGDLFPGCNYKRTESYFPFTEPSWEYEVEFEGAWLEVLGCGVIQPQIIEDAGLGGEQGWAFGLGLDRLAMILFGIPDIRLLWSEDERFLGQFRDEVIKRFKPFSTMPPCYKDVTFWLPEGFSYSAFCEMVRDIGGDLVESVKEIDSFTKEVSVENTMLTETKTSKCFRITYRSLHKTLHSVEVDLLQDRVRKAIRLELRGELR